MESQEKQDTFLALRGGLQGRMALSFDMLENTLEVLQCRLDDTTNASDQEDIAALLAAAREELCDLRRLSRHTVHAACVGLREPELYPMELAGTLRDMCDFCSRDLQSMGSCVEIKLTCEPGVQILPTMGDTRLVVRILGNLLSNAMEAGAQHIRLHLYENKLVCADDGCGLPPDALSLLNTGESAARLEQCGATGLREIRRCAEAMGWQIRALQGQGTQLEFTLPPCTVDIGSLLLESDNWYAGRSREVLHGELVHGLRTSRQ